MDGTRGKTSHSQVRLWLPAWGLLLAVLAALASPVAASAQQPPQESDVEYYHADAVGTVRLVTGAGGAVLARHDYTPFGTPFVTPTPQSAAPSREQPRGFAGKEFDSETGFDYFGGRFLQTNVSRFTTPDGPGNDQHPGDPQSWNLYAYTRNNPLKLVDDGGRSATLTGGLVGGVIGAGVALWRGDDVVAGAVSGAVAGALAGAVIDTGGAALGVYGAAALGGAVGGAGGGVASRVMHGQATTAGDVATDAAFGAAAGVAGAAVGQAVSALRSGATAAGASAEANAAAGARPLPSSKYADATGKGRNVIPNRSTNVSRPEFEQNLESGGWTSTSRGGGQVTEFTKDGRKYVTRDGAKSTGGPTADYYQNAQGKTSLKIRLDDKEP